MPHDSFLDEIGVLVPKANPSYDRSAAVGTDKNDTDRRKRRATRHRENG